MEIIVTIVAVGMLVAGYGIIFGSRNAAPAGTAETGTDIQV